MDKKEKNTSDFNSIILFGLIAIVLAGFFVLKTEMSELSDRLEKAEASNNNNYLKAESLKDEILKNRFLLEYADKKLGLTEFAESNLQDIPINVPQAKASELIELSADASEICVNNLKYMNNIQQFGPEFIIEYVSSSRDKMTGCIVMSSIKEISDEICKNAATDKEKADRIAEWVCLNIYYNHVAAANEISNETICLETVLATKKTTCAGYSNIFAAMCQSQGMYCINIRGGASETADISSLPTNHEWNGVYCDGKWLFYDTTWASQNRYLNGAYSMVDTYNSSYFAMDFETMSQLHRIDKLDFRDFYNAFKEFNK